jgi:hypothetical protein
VDGMERTTVGAEAAVAASRKNRNDEPHLRAEEWPAPLLPSAHPAIFTDEDVGHRALWPLGIPGVEGSTTQARPTPAVPYRHVRSLDADGSSRPTARHLGQWRGHWLQTSGGHLM